MPLYVYRCPNGHEDERLRKYPERDAAIACLTCGQPSQRTMSAHHAQPDGLYSHDPNQGDEAKFQRNLEGIERLKTRIGEKKDRHHPHSGFGH